MSDMSNDCPGDLFSVQFCSANLIKDYLKLVLVTLSSAAPRIDVDRHDITLGRGLGLIGTPAKS